MTRAAWALLLLSGCSQPSQPSQPAGHVDAGRARVVRETDLRSSLLILYPEYRGVAMRSGQATLTRTVTGPATEAAKLARSTLEVNQFAPQGPRWVRVPYQATIEGRTWAMSVPLDQATVEKLFAAPTAMSTRDLAMWFPRGAALPTEREVFELSLTYEATEARAIFLTRQLVRLLLGSGQWRARLLPAAWATDDGTTTHDAFEARLEEVTTHAVVSVRREGGSVELHYTLVTDEP